MSEDIYTEAHEHFLNSGRQYEYGRPDMRLANKGGDGHTDTSRTEQDNDHDGRLGVDCSSLVWRGLKDAGYNVGNAPFGTSTLFEGSQITAYSKEHFDVVSAPDTRKLNGALQPGDVLMFEDKKSSGQHVGIFKGYDKDGHIEFLGSQVSTGPKEVVIKPGGYWDGDRFEIVGALRAKPEFRVHAPVNEHPGAAAASPQMPMAHDSPASTAPHAAVMADGLLRQGKHNTEVHTLQQNLSKLGYTDARGHALKPDSDFGLNTKHAVEAFQHDHHLTVDGVAGPQTLEAIHLAQAKHVASNLADPKNPDHALYEQARVAVHHLDASMGRTSDRQSDQLAASLVVAAKHERMTAIDTVVLSEDGSRAFAVQGRLDSPLRQMAHVPTAEAVNTPIDKSSAAVQAVNQQQAQQQPTPPPVPAQASPAPAVSR